MVDLFVEDPSAYSDFLTDLSYGADEFDLKPADPESFSACSADSGRALERYVSDLGRRKPTWAQVDTAQVDWPEVSSALERRLLQLVCFGN